MSMNTFRAFLKSPKENPDLIQSQIKALSQRIPLLYFIVIVNTMAVAWTHYGIAPDILIVGFPILVLFAGLIRSRSWLQTRTLATSDADAHRRLKTTVIVAGAFGAMFLAWGLTLYRYGDAYQQGHVAFYMAITVISCFFCLMHVRPAALVLAGVTVVPFTIFMLLTGRPVFIAIAINMAVVTAAMVYVLLTYSRDFANLIGFQEKLAQTLQGRNRARAGQR